jgi:hypothetical protein
VCVHYIYIYINIYIMYMYTTIYTHIYRCMRGRSSCMYIHTYISIYCTYVYNYLSIYIWVLEARLVNLDPFCTKVGAFYQEG